MAHTFDIRFARSEGLAALFEAPTNSFRWAGNGQLSIDGQGISVAVQRGLLSLLVRNRIQRIPTANLKDVFREGDALRVEFATLESPRASLRFWARDRETAAQIVQLLPTSRTVEIEENPPAGRFRLNWRALTLSGAALAAFVFGGVILREKMVAVPGSGTASTRPSQNASPAPGANETPAATAQKSAGSLAAKLPGAAAPEEVAPATSGPLVFEVRVRRGGIVPLVPGMYSYEAARRQMRLFIEESVDGQWWGMTVRIQHSLDFHEPGLWPLQEAELAAARAWLDYFQFYQGSGLDDAYAQREFARMLTRRVYQYVD